MTDSVVAAKEAPWPSPVTGWYSVTILMLAYIASYVDRQILTQLVGPIRADLGISDTQFSLLHGLAFALFYTIMGIPIARLADRYSRRAIVATGVAFWSFMTGICGLASNFWQLFAARMGVGVGEAALSPAAYSMISDLFPKERRGAALGLYSTGVFLGIGFAFMIGAFVISRLEGLSSLDVPLIGAVRPWQVVFFVVGFPGLALAALLLTLREPVRRDSLEAARVPPSSIKDLVAFLKLNRATILLHFVGFSTITLVFNAIITWAPAYFDRRHGIAVQDSGTWLGLVVVIFGTAGIFLGGLLSDRFLRQGKTHGPLIVGVIAATALVPVAGSLSLITDPRLSMAMFAPFLFFVSFPFAAAIAGLQMITPNRLRAQVGALYLFTVNLTGIGLGGTFTAVLTDYVFQSDQMLHFSMAMAGGGGSIVAAIVLYCAIGPFKASAARHAA
ncbi:MAG: MFS transporter [Alphaproteobacteria bacterium]|nr:MAG: MFS transporter [Alphaproteobacteria bacterium]